MLKTFGLAGLWLFGLAAWSAGEVIYDNSIHDLQYRFNPGLNEVGDEIILGGTARQLTFFQFEYWGTNAFSPIFEGYVEACVRFYVNDQLDLKTFYFAPGTVLFDSGWFGVAATPRATLIFDDFQTGAAVPLTEPVPDTFTWSVQFRGLGPNDTAGVDLYSPPVVGDELRDYWENIYGEWVLKTNSVVFVNFAVLIHAEAPPELSVAIGSPEQMTVSWPEQSIAYRLQETSQLSPGISWSPVPTTPLRTNGHYVVTLPVAGQRKFFRLISP